MFVVILEAIIIASSCSLDAFAASFAYGSNKIKIPMLSVQIINIISSAIMGISLLVGSIVKNYLPEGLTCVFCFTILFVLGVIKLFDSVTKSIIKKHSNINKELKFSMFNFKFILKLYADPVEADVDFSKTISPAEATSLAIALSLDGIAVGFGAALGAVLGWVVFGASLVINMIAVISGCALGNKLAKKIPFDLSWVSGVILIALAFLKL